MNTKTEDLEALQLALKMETDGYKFFKDAGERTQNILAKETFKSFAQWELEHVEFIKKTYQELKESGKWTSTDQMSQKKGDAIATFKTIFREKHEKIDENVQINATDLDAFRLARDIEDKAVVFYQEKAKSAKSDAATKFYLFMVVLEREHHQILDNSYRYFENPVQWNIEDEGWMFDGG